MEPHVAHWLWNAHPCYNHCCDFNQLVSSLFKYSGTQVQWNLSKSGHQLNCSGVNFSIVANLLNRIPNCKLMVNNRSGLEPINNNMFLQLCNSVYQVETVNRLTASNIIIYIIYYFSYA